MTTQLPPDYETRHTLALALCVHLGINPEHVALGSMQIELGPYARHRVTWTGHAHLNLDDLAGVLHEARIARTNPLDEIEIGETGYQGRRRTRYDYPPT